MKIDQSVIDSIPRHPADPNVAYGYDLDPAVIRPLLEDRILVAAIFRDFCPKDERMAHVTQSLQDGFRSASTYFNSHNFSPERGDTLAKMRLMAFDKQGIFPQTPDYEPRHKTLEDFTGSTWLHEKMDRMSIWPQKKMGEYGFHILHAFAGATDKGLTPYWHPHQDITAHLTISEGGGLEWMPSDVDPEDLRRNPQKYEDRAQVVAPGDLIAMGRLLHRSTSKIHEHGQFSIIAGGPLVSEYENS